MLYAVSLSFVSTPLPKPHCLFTEALYSKSTAMPPSLLFILKTVLAILLSLPFYINFKFFVRINKISCQDSERNFVKCIDRLVKTVILTKPNLSINEYGLSFHYLGIL